jgi:Tfp pilus assembly protein PilV
MKKNSGVTLLEVIISLVILALVVISVSFAITVAIKNATRNRNRIVALGYAVSTIEWLKNYVTADTTATKYNYSGAYALAQNTTGVSMPFSADYESNYQTPLANLNATRNYTVTDIDLNADNVPDLKKVTVTVNWTEPAQ